MYYITFIHRIKRYHKTKRKKRQYTTDNVNLTKRNKTTQHQTPKQLHKPWHNLHEHLYYVQSDINTYNPLPNFKQHLKTYLFIRSYYESSS